MSSIELANIIDAFRDLSGSKIYGYGPSRIPNDIDEMLSNILGRYLSLDEKERNKVREALIREQKFLLLGFSERMASLAVRSRCQEPLIQAMIAMFLQSGIGDVREDIAVLTLVHAAARKLGIDPRLVFVESANALALNNFSGLEAFLQRSEDDRSIDSMGYSEGSDIDGFRFVRSW